MVMKECNVERERLLLYLEGSLPNAEAQDVEAHLEECETCQSLQIVEAELAAVLRDKLPRERANVELRPRVLAALELGHGAEPAGIVAFHPSRTRRVLASNWMPRLAMAAVLAFLLLVPVRGLFRAPALAQEAIERHDCHAPSFAGDDTPPCCRDLMLAVGDVLAAPSLGRRVPDLAPGGLELAAVTHCNFKGVAVNMVGYQGPDATTFSLYITDQVTEQFMQHSTREVSGLTQARHSVKGSDVTMWERDGLIYFWVGPHESPSYDQALVRLLEM
jgi:anti-sigma factor RsiW